MVLKAMDSDWENLPKDLLDLIFERLELQSDYLAFSVVCKSWNSVAKNNCSQAGPMLLISSDKKDTWKLYDVTNDKVLDLRLRLSNKRFSGSSKGWLVVVEENYAVTLMNPFSRVKGCKEKENSIISLPPLMHPDQSFKDLNHCLCKATISTYPILNADSCIVTVIYGDHDHFAFIRLGQDTNWTYIDDRGLQFPLVEEVVHIGDKVYAVNQRGRLLSFDITSESEIKCKNFSEEVKNSLRMSSKTYLLNSNEKGLLIVKRHANWEGNVLDGKAVTYKFEIFELNFDKHEWIEKETLDDAALFLGNNSSVFVVASKFPGCQPNCIYFNSDWHPANWGPEDFGVYNIKTQSISKPYTTTAMALLGRTTRPAMWVVPTSRQ
ncbi:F-box protein SKIP23-like [Prunus avium]|uniref:F-box protein SKIP23-like n=1 Tax=Prunus avium TaxID=42229 RepID=A0A6P5STH4_PRUAV|nr:F-box protein SKIP23-like [Prunus avium]